MIVNGSHLTVRKQHERPCGRIITIGRVELDGYAERGILVVTGRSGHLHYEVKNKFFRLSKGEDL